MASNLLIVEIAIYHSNIHYSPHSYGTFIKVNLLEKVSEFLVSIDTSFWSLNAPGYGLLFFIFVVSFTFVRVKKHQPKLH